MTQSTLNLRRPVLALTQQTSAQDMTPPQALDRKRQRPTCSSDEEAPFSDSDRHASENRVGQAERKRELERNRRNLINVRFSELDAQLRRTAPCRDVNSQQDTAASPLPKPSSLKGRRIDKEAVLKEAIHRLARKEQEIREATNRIQAMSMEIDNLRAEKVELREDKSYLRGELEASRSELKRLRADNVCLWQTCRKATYLKTQLAPEVTKLPADFFAPADPSVERQNDAEKSYGTAVPVNVTPDCSIAPQNNTLTAPAPASAPSPCTSEMPKDTVRLHDTFSMGHESLNTLSRSSDIASVTHCPLPDQDTFLTFQSPEDISELFANFPYGGAYTSPVCSNDGPRNAPQRRQMPLPVQPSPQVTRAAEIAAASIAARSMRPMQQATPTPVTGGDMLLSDEMQPIIPLMLDSGDGTVPEAQVQESRTDIDGTLSSHGTDRGNQYGRGGRNSNPSQANKGGGDVTIDIAHCV